MEARLGGKPIFRILLDSGERIIARYWRSQSGDVWPVAGCHNHSHIRDAHRLLDDASQVLEKSFGGWHVTAKTDTREERVIAMAILAVVGTGRAADGSTLIIRLQVSQWRGLSDPCPVSGFSSRISTKSPLELVNVVLQRDAIVNSPASALHHPECSKGVHSPL